MLKKRRCCSSGFPANHTSSLKPWTLFCKPSKPKAPPKSSKKAFQAPAKSHKKRWAFEGRVPCPRRPRSRRRHRSGTRPQRFEAVGQTGFGSNGFQNPKSLLPCQGTRGKEGSLARLSPLSAPFWRSSSWAVGWAAPSVARRRRCIPRALESNENLVC